MPFVLCVGSSLTACITSGSRPIIPNALRGAGHSFQSDGIPALAGEFNNTFSKYVLVVVLISEPDGHSQRMCSVVSSRFSVQCGHALSLVYPAGVLIPAELSLT